MSLAQLCAESAETGVRFINRDTGQPVACPGAPPVAVAQAPAPVAPAAVSAAQVRVPAAEAFPPLSREQMAATLADRQPAPRVADNFPPIALSQAAVQTPPPGYRPAFEDGRLNPDRGLLPAASRPAVAGGHFVQVGTYGVPSNADRAASRMQALGFPVAFQTTRYNGQQVRVVAAGPFATRAEAQTALHAARNAGYGDAFIR
ncbi:MAG: SPOR domain-containing protein [Rubellimicrobium sp.]|nr:SPOR domain-containing protein [Rubellimicrobium sp.]